MKKGILTVISVLFLITALTWGSSLGSPISDGPLPGTPIGEGSFPESPISGGTVWWYSGLTFWAPFSDPSAPLTLNKGTGSLSMTRATTRTYTHPTTNLVTTAASGQLAIESAGASIEGQRTNLIKYSSNFTVADWVKRGSVVIGASTTGPDGIDNSAYSVTNLGGDGVDDIYQAITTTIGQAYVPSFYIKRISTSGVLALKSVVIADVGNKILIDLSLLGDGWERIVKGHPAVTTNFDLQNAANTTEYHQIFANSGGPLSIYLYGNQWENVSFPSSYIPTTSAAVTRNADVLTQPTSGNIDNVDGTLALQWTPKFASTDNVVTAVLFDAGGLKATYTSADKKINFTDGTNTVSSAALTFSANVVQKLAFRWGPSGLLVYRNGSQAATGATYTAPVLNANLYIGSDVSSANQAYSGIKPVRTWNREFSAAEMGTITQ